VLCDAAGVDNSDVAQEDLYSKPEEIYEVYTELNKVAPGMFSIAAAFGNVHGVYKPGNVKLTPKILGDAQKYVIEKEGLKEGSKPVYFVFHGGSGSTREEIREAIGYAHPPATLHRPQQCICLACAAFALVKMAYRVRGGRRQPRNPSVLSTSTDALCHRRHGCYPHRSHRLSL
jgi:hypothetical protein